MDEITKTAIQFVPNDIKKNFGNAAYLMNAALNFIKDVELIVTRYEHEGKRLSLFQSVNLNQVALVMRHQKNALQELISKQYLFESQVNQFLGRTINFAWADNKGNILFTDEVSARKIYESATIIYKDSQYAGKINFSSMKSKELEDKITTVPTFVRKRYQEAISKRLQKHQALYQEVLQRWQNNNSDHYADGSKNFWYKEHKHTIYWEHPPKGTDKFHHHRWAWSSNIVNRGPISEGYVDFIFNPIRGITLNEKSIGTFVTNYVQHDQTPGIAKGDVVMKTSNGKIHIAVKSGEEQQTAGIRPYISVAYQIIEFFNNLDQLTVDNVQHVLDNLARYNQKIVKAGKEEAQKILKDKLFYSTETIKIT